MRTASSLYVISAKCGVVPGEVRAPVRVTRESDTAILQISLCIGKLNPNVAPLHSG